MYNSAIFNDRYKCIKKIGQGGMSSVFLCIDQNIQKKWAVKIITRGQFDEKNRPYKSYENNSNEIKNIFSPISSEITLLKSLDYYMFPRITDAFLEGDYVGIVTDYIEGETLDSYLKREGPIPVNTALRYFEELLKALEYLHSQNPGIIYLDMKPENIMIRPDGEIRLIDFGIASSVLLKGRSLGTIGYSPPEQYVAGRLLTEKTDIFALAMTLYVMLTAKKPQKDLAIQTDLIKREKSIPLFLRELIVRCVNPDEKSRPDTGEISRIIRNKSGTERGVFPTVLAFIAILIATSLAVYWGATAYRQKKYEEYRNEMIKKASVYVDNGEYTKLGLRVISGYLSGDFLDDDTKEYYTFVVAKNYFEVQKDYASAQYYFRKLSSEKYPELEEYLSVCKRMKGFENDDERIYMLMKNEVEDRKERTYGK